MINNGPGVSTLVFKQMPCDRAQLTNNTEGASYDDGSGS